MSNQVVVGDSGDSVYIPGQLSAVSISNLTTVATSTNILRGDISFPRSAVATVANGHNTINVGTNVPYSYLNQVEEFGVQWGAGIKGRF